MIDVSIIIPCHHEGATVANTIEALKHTDTCGLTVEYIFVDNASTDNTCALISEHGATNMQVVVNSENKGYGAAIKTGINVAQGQYIGWMHCNGKTSPSALSSFFNYIHAHPTRSYFLKAIRKNSSFKDRVFSWCYDKIASLMFYSSMKDINAVPVVYPSGILKSSATYSMPDDEAIHVFAYKEAQSSGLEEERISVYYRAKEETFKEKWANIRALRKCLKRMKNDGYIR